MLDCKSWNSTALREPLLNDVCLVKFERSKTLQPRAMCKEFTCESKDREPALALDLPNNAALCRSMSHQVA